MEKAKSKSRENKANARNTIQRAKILEFLQNNYNHPTAEDVYEAIKKEIPTITLATVYRNLHFLADQGKILRLEINKEFHFDFQTKFHFHFFCEENNNIIDIFPNQRIYNSIKKEVEKRNLNLASVDVVINGSCRQFNMH